MRANSYRILVFSAFGLLGIASLGVAYLLNQSYLRYIANAEESSQNLALSLEQFLGAHFQQSELALKNAAAEYQREQTTRTFTPQRFSDYLKSLHERLPYAMSIRGTDRDGNVVYGELPPDAPAFSHADREDFQRARREGSLVFGQMSRSSLTGQSLFPIIYPLSNPDGSFAGTVYVNTETARIADLFASIKLGERGVITLFDGDRRLLMRHPGTNDTDAAGKAVRMTSPHILAALEEGKAQATFEGVSRIDGHKRSLSYRQVGHYPVYVVVGLAHEDFLSAWKSECLLGVGFLLVLTTGTIALGLAVRRWLQIQLQIKALQATKAAHDHLDAILCAIPDVLFELDIHGNYLDYRSVGPDALDRPAEEFIGRNVADILPGSAALALLKALAEANREGHSYGTQIHIAVPSGELWFELSIARKNDAGEGNDPTFIVLSRDITERNQAQARIEQMAFSDMLTGLPNRRLFLDRLKHCMAASDRSQHYLALLFLDLDKFKTLNDTMGHQYGDMLLTQTAERLRRSVREGDTVARLGGDEFVVLLEQLGHSLPEAAKLAQGVAEKIAEQLGLEYDLDGRGYRGTGSIGITLFRGTGASTTELLKRADLAMYQAKAAGRNAVCFFDPTMQANISERLDLEVDLKRAMEDGQFKLYFQPQMDMQGKLVGVEALLRWQSQKRGFVSPTDFIPLAEETGLILPIGHWVLREVCGCLKAWERIPALAKVAISVNISARQLMLPTFVEEVTQLVEHFQIQPSLLKLEIRESLLVDRVDEIVAKINALRAVGVNFVLDDFGTGYTSLSHLQRLPFNQIKIAQSFASGVLNDPDGAAVCRAIIALGDALGLEVVAEGVETPGQWDFFTNEGCHRGQGYLFGHPVSQADFEGNYPLLEGENDEAPRMAARLYN